MSHGQITIEQLGIRFTSFYRLMCWHILALSNQDLKPGVYAKIISRNVSPTTNFMNNCGIAKSGIANNSWRSTASNKWSSLLNRTWLPNTTSLFPLKSLINSTNMSVSMSFFSLIREQFLLLVPFWFLLIVGRGGAGCMLLLHVQE